MRCDNTNWDNVGLEINLECSRLTRFVGRLDPAPWKCYSGPKNCALVYPSLCSTKTPCGRNGPWNWDCHVLQAFTRMPHTSRTAGGISLGLYAHGPSASIPSGRELTSLPRGLHKLCRHNFCFLKQLVMIISLPFAGVDCKDFRQT